MRRPMRTISHEGWCPKCGIKVSIDTYVSKCKAGHNVKHGKLLQVPFGFRDTEANRKRARNGDIG